MKPEKKEFVEFDESTDTAMYIALKDHLGKGKPHLGSYQKGLHEIIDSYKGPEIYLDFNSEGRLYGIEILGD
jgi:uncharacterized protein YuzE